MLACYSPADFADYAEECSKAALYRRETANSMNNMKGCISTMWNLSFVCVNLRNLRENRPFTYKGRTRKEQASLIVSLSTLACYSPTDYADDAEECSKAALFRRETANSKQREPHISTVCYLSFVCVNQRNLRENRPFTHKERAREEQASLTDLLYQREQITSHRYSQTNSMNS